MKANYHTHTWRCNHAEGTEAEYVEAAIARGLETLGFSDHTPYFFPGEYYSTFRMRMNQLDGYIACISELQHQYRDSIRIEIGLEAEFYPALFPDLMARLRQSDIKYLILGQHMIGNEINEHYSGHPTDEKQILYRYTHQVMDAFQTGYFTYLAHPDLINFVGTHSDYRSAMRELCMEAKSCNIPLEYNLLGLSGGRHYPNSRFWEIAAEVGNTVVLGCDAHNVDALRNTAYEKEALDNLRLLGITPQELPKIVSIK